MSMVTNTLGRYFAGRFVVAALGVFAAIFVLLVLVDYIEMVRKTSGLVDVSAIAVAETSLFRVPQLLEKMMPFCILIGAMTCYLALSRRLELVVARAAGVSAWQFIAPSLASALIMGVLATIAYNPMSATLRELSKRMEAELFGNAPGGGVQDAAGFWINQVNSDGQAIINAARSEQQGVRLTGLTVFRFDNNDQFQERIEAQQATLEDLALGDELLALAKFQRIANGLQVGCHLARQHLQITGAKHPRGSAQVRHILQSDGLLLLVNRAAGWHAVGWVKSQEVESLAENEHARNEIAAAAGNAVWHVMAAITGVGIRTGEAVKCS